MGAIDTEILKPAVILIAWTLVMLVWTLATRMPALKKAGVDVKTLRGGKGSDADRVLPAEKQWVAHNYNHLLEQPTAFYAVVVILALIGHGHGMNVWIAWAYVGIRIVHSIVQATWNRVIVRFVLFLASTLALVALTLHAVIPLFDLHLHN